MRRCTRFAFGAFGAIVFGVAGGPTRADEKGEGLLRQVTAVAHTLEPLVGKYTVAATGAVTHFQGDYSETIHFGGGGSWGGRGSLPDETFRLFDSLLPFGSSTRYIGRQTIEGVAYEVVEQTQSLFILRYFTGEGAGCGCRAGQPCFHAGNARYRGSSGLFAGQ